VLGKGLFGTRLAAGIEGAVHGAVDITDRDAVRVLPNCPHVFHKS
jgi:hypothetical protein